MISKIIGTYKFSLLVSLITAVVVMAMTVSRAPGDIISIILGALLGAIVLEADYFIYAFFLEPNNEFSKSLRSFIEHKDFKSALNHIVYNKDSIPDKTLNSAIFQMAIGFIMLVTVFAPTNILIKTLLISTFANTLYRMLEEYFEGRINMWFWAFKSKPGINGIKAYTLIMFAALVCAFLFL